MIPTWLSQTNSLEVKISKTERQQMGIPATLEKLRSRKCSSAVAGK
jgi:hypothetical protein